jgi:hypothetical protein
MPGVKKATVIYVTPSREERRESYRDRRQAIQRRLRRGPSAPPRDFTLDVGEWDGIIGKGSKHDQ